MRRRSGRAANPRVRAHSCPPVAAHGHAAVEHASRAARGPAAPTLEQREEAAWRAAGSMPDELAKSGDRETARTCIDLRTEWHELRSPIRSHHFSAVSTTAFHVWSDVHFEGHDFRARGDARARAARCRLVPNRLHGAQIAGSAERRSCRAASSKGSSSELEQRSRAIAVVQEVV